ncbi:hypothetical protein [Falsirhodobacter sp. 1013]|uniref:hypothetical protein n=1 Tax=Falsirhodobacter sp. 1013 TaxID=3417566 RepID=UPI003EBF981F
MLFSPATATAERLGGSGVMAYLPSDDLQGLHQARIGSSRAEVRFADSRSPGAPSPEYEGEGSALVLPLTVIKVLPAASGTNFLRFTYAFTRGDTDRNIAPENDSKISRAVVQSCTPPPPARSMAWG